MAALPERENTTVRAIDAAVEASADGPFREHLGASIIGRECERELWYSFRWTTDTRHSGRLLRLFARGHLEEQRFTQYLRAVGCTVLAEDEGSGAQYTFSDCDGHMGGSMDGAVKGLIEAPKTWHVLEYKTHGDKSFRDLSRKGVQASKPEHYAQMQLYMHWSGMERAYYLGVNKNDDSLYGERIHYDKATAEALIAKGRRIIASDRPLERISADPAFYKCKFCDHSDACHGTAVPPPTCRSCAHASPVPGGWRCEHHGRDLDKQAQLAGCTDHAYIPPLLANWAKPIDAIGGCTEYETPDGRRFLNGPGTAAYSSLEIYRAADKRIIGSAVANATKAEFPGTEVAG